MKHGISCLLLMGMRICVQNATCEIRNFQFYHMEFHVFFQRQLLRDLPLGMWIFLSFKIPPHKCEYILLKGICSDSWLHT
jgi:hypothetical protein